MFSVLLSIYKEESCRSLNECLHSIWTYQTLKPNEIVLVEDGPLLDELSCLIDDWETKLGQKIKRIKLKKNVGTGLAKNIGLKKCQYNLVAIVDADDICCSDRFEQQYNFMKMHDDFTIVGGQIFEFVENISNLTAKRIVPTSHIDILKFSKFRNPFNNMTIMYRKDHILNVGGYKHHWWMEDYNLVLRVIAHNYKVANLSKVLVYARVNTMHSRRAGMQYIKSEFQLLKLKRELKLQSYLGAFLVTCIRSNVRLLPSKYLGKFYNIFLRKRK